jgi:AraC family transcriptional regulator of arabinose operon
MAERLRYISVVNLKRKLVPPEPRHLSKTYARKQRGRVVIGDVLYAKGGSFGPRMQEDFQLVVIHSGSLTLRLDDDVVAVPEGHAILLSPGHREHFYFARDRETRHSWIALSPAALDKDLRIRFNRFRGPFPFCGLMASLLDAARQDLSPIYDGEALHDRFHESLGISILCAFASAVCEGHYSSVIHETILWRMDSFLGEHYARRLTLLQIAYAAGASRQHLLKLCRNAGRQTPMAQLYAKRLEVAVDLLIHTGFSIAEIADRCGFSNQFHFSRKFKQKFKSSPSAWRKRLWK